MDASRPDRNGAEANVISFDLGASDVELYEAARALLLTAHHSENHRVVAAMRGESGALSRTAIDAKRIKRAPNPAPRQCPHGAGASNPLRGSRQHARPGSTPGHEPDAASAWDLLVFLRNRDLRPGRCRGRSGWSGSRNCCHFPGCGPRKRSGTPLLACVEGQHHLAQPFQLARSRGRFEHSERPLLRVSRGAWATAAVVVPNPGRSAVPLSLRRNLCRAETGHTESWCSRRVSAKPLHQQVVRIF